MMSMFDELNMNMEHRRKMLTEENRSIGSNMFRCRFVHYKPHIDWLVCDLETSRMRRPWPVFGRGATGKKKS